MYDKGQSHIKEGFCMNEMIQQMLTRHAIRRYQDTQVEEALLEQVLEAGLHAPSAGNNQYSRIVVCQDRTINNKLGRMSRDIQFIGCKPNEMLQPISAEQPSIKDDLAIVDGYYQAPTVVTLFTRQGRYAHDDAAMMGENILLAAHFLGLGACYIGRAEEVFATEYGMTLRKEWGIPEDMVAVCNILLGYREGPAPKTKPRKEGRIVRIG